MNLPARPQPFIQPELAAHVVAPEQTTWDVSAMRAAGEALQQFAVPIPAGVRRDVLDVSRRDGEGQLELRVFHPEVGDSTSPVMVAPHGGGYVAGLARYDDARNAELAARLGAIVVSPCYRLAPEHPFPAARDDVAQAFMWASETFPHSPLWGFGDSAGSGLLYTGGIEYLLRGGRAIDKAVFLEPCLDPTLAYPSMTTFADGPVWTKRAAAHAWAAYGAGAFPDDVTPPVEHAVACVRKAGAELPACYVVVNPVDPLRDEGIRFACDLVDAGLECQLHMWEGTFHGSLGYPVDSWREMMGSIERFFTGMCRA